MALSNKKILLIFHLHALKYNNHFKIYLILIIINILMKFILPNKMLYIRDYLIFFSYIPTMLIYTQDLKHNQVLFYKVYNITAFDNNYIKLIIISILLTVSITSNSILGNNLCLWLDSITHIFIGFQVMVIIYNINILFYKFLILAIVTLFLNLLMKQFEWYILLIIFSTILQILIFYKKGYERNNLF
ncbi:hypothetical protein SAMN04488541_103838 [Thermoflexibacter ruber]|uniref:Uncharacterized protein n=1 Tax=Thermoflexibacter ruber TaxID=1003 RepID=A0A1I2IZE3_9BACT|nr:hypothetical protein SAMN04488541_103838 [Thermoflexibacter ruber]